MTQESGNSQVDELEKDIFGQVMGMHWSCARFVSLVVVDNGNGTFEVMYVFHTENGISVKKFTIPNDLELESISDFWSGAQLMEREAIDLFGIKIKGMEGGALLVPGKSPAVPLRKKATEGQNG